MLIDPFDHLLEISGGTATPFFKQSIYIE